VTKNYTVEMSLDGVTIYIWKGALEEYCCSRHDRELALRTAYEQGTKEGLLDLSMESSLIYTVNGWPQEGPWNE